MDIEEFYSADERRRQSAEVELGTNWFDAKGSRYELSWVRGHRRALRDARAGPRGRLVDTVRRQRGRADPGGPGAGHGGRLHPHARARWRRSWPAGPTQMAKPDGISWVAERLRADGVPAAAPA